jgi:Zn-dependent protease
MVGSSYSLGRIAGVRIGIHYSFLFIALLICYRAFELLSLYAPSYSELTYVVFSILGTVLFCFSILWHEVAHMLVAKLYKLRVRQIVLFFLGGVAEIEDEPRTAGQEFWIAFVGPLSSFVLGLLFLGFYIPLGRGNITGEMLFGLGYFNILLAAFNMLPSFPLDGGRVLRAVLWGISSNYMTGTRISSYLGQGMAWLCIGFGIFSLRNPGMFGGSLMMLFLGWFLLSQARQHLQRAEVRAGLSGVLVGQLVSSMRIVEAHWPLAYALDMMAIENTATAAPVVRNNEIVGILSVEHLRILPRQQWGHLHVDAVMTPIASVRTIDAGYDLFEALQQSHLDQQPYLLVTSNQQPIGLLSHREIVNFAKRQLGSS